MTTEQEKFKPLITLKKGRGGVWATGYHIVWCFKYRKKIFDSDAFKQAAKFYIRETCENNDIELIEIEMDRDHVHVFVSFPPKHSGVFVMKRMKGYSSRMLRKGFPESRHSTGDSALWSPSYYFGTVGQVTAEGIKAYIEANAGKSDDPTPSL